MKILLAFPLNIFCLGIVLAIAQKTWEFFKQFLSYFASVISLRILSELILIFRNFVLENSSEIQLDAVSAIPLEVRLLIFFLEKLFGNP